VIEVKVEQVEQPAGLALGTSTGASRREERLRPENVVQTTYDCMRYEAPVPVAQEALFIRFGLVLHSKGQIWLANGQVEGREQDAKDSLHICDEGNVSSGDETIS
jgi:hypothetical protein